MGVVPVGVAIFAPFESIAEVASVLAGVEGLRGDTALFLGLAGSDSTSKVRSIGGSGL